MTAKGKRDASRGTGPLCSTVPGAKYPFYKWSKYWVSEEAWREYSKREAQRRRAKDILGDRNRVDEFLEMEKQARDARTLHRQRERRAQFELDRLRVKHNLKPNANTQTLKKVWERTGDPEILAFLHLKSTLTMGDKERVDRIRQLFLNEELKPYDILYQTAIIVGINLRKK